MTALFAVPQGGLLIDIRTPPIRGIVEVSLTHWSGRISSVIHLGGCTLLCPTCPAPHLVAWERNGSQIPLDAVLDAIYRRRRWIEGVVIKGGEPFAHPELADLLELLRDFGLDTRVDTNGTCPAEMEEMIRRDLVDFVSLEVKAPLTEKYGRVTGTSVDLADIFDSIEILLSGVVEYEFRTVVYDGVLAEEDVIAIARTLRGARRYVLRAVPGRGPGRAALRRIARRAGRHVAACHVEGQPPAGPLPPPEAVFAEGHPR